MDWLEQHGATENRITFRKLLILMVGTIGLEPTTSSVSRHTHSMFSMTYKGAMVFISSAKS